MTPEERDAIAARVSAATPAPWSAKLHGSAWRVVPTGGSSEIGDKNPLTLLRWGDRTSLLWGFAICDMGDDSPAAEADARLVAAAPTDLLALLADVDRAEHDMRNAVFLYQQMRNALRAYFGGSAQASARAELLLRDLAGMGRE